MKKLALALLLLASPAMAGTWMTFGDSRCFSGFPSSPTWPSKVAVQRPDWTHVVRCVPGRDTSATAALSADLSAYNMGVGDAVFIDLTINDPYQLGDNSALGSYQRLRAMCDLVEATGATCVLATPTHAPTTRGITLDHEDYGDAVAELIRTGDTPYIDIRAAHSLAEWQSWMDVWTLHCGTDACRQDIADYVAPRLP